MKLKIIVLLVVCSSLILGCSATLKHGWEVVAESLPDPLKESIELLLPVRQSNMDVVESFLLDVSNPRSLNYGKYMSFDELGTLVRPSVESIRAVEQWLRQRDATEVSWNPHREFVRCRVLLASLSPASRWRYVQHPARGPKPALVRSLDRIAVPAELVGHVDFLPSVDVQGLLPVPRAKALSPRPSRDHAASPPALSLFTASAMDSVVQVQAALPAASVASVQSVQFTLSQPWASQATTHTITVVPQASISAEFDNVGNVINSTLSATVVFTNGTSQTVPYQSLLYPGPLITPNVAKRLYSVPDHEFGSGQFGNAMSVAEFDGQYYSPSDLKQFLSLVDYTPQHGVSVNVSLGGDGGNIPSLPGGESTLDVDWTLAIAPNVPLVFWSVRLGGFLIEWAQQVAAASNPPFVHSVSYGVPETDETADYTNRVDQELIKLGARGITVISTSGDIGVEDGASCSPDTPDYPSSSPWTTSLGATSLVRNTDMPICSSYRCDQMQETPCAADLGSGFTTGGGFSFRYPTPSYQQAAVAKYLATAPDLPPATFFNSSGRGYNDIATLGYRMLVVQRGKPGASGGTSASGPLAAGLFSLINGARLAKGMPTLGFVNPWLYTVATQYQDAFHAVGLATNKCEETGNFGETDCCPFGFTSTPGWNPLGGLGTPNYAILKQAALTSTNSYE